MLSTNFGPFNDNQWVKDFKEHFKNATYICFRDKVSYNLFKDLKNVNWAPDVVLSLGQMLHRNKTGKKQILISIIDCGLEIRPENVKKYQNVYENKIVEICNYYLDKDYTVKVLTSNNEQDYPAAKRIQDTCYRQIELKPEIVEYDGDLNKIFGEYKKSDYVIATRLHAIILAWLYQLPLIPIVYDVKVKTLLESYMFECLSIDLESIKKIFVQEIDKALINYEFKNLNSLFLESNKQFKLLDKLLL